MSRPISESPSASRTVESLGLHLAAAWVAVAPLYLVGANWCPRPLYAVVLATTAGTFVALFEPSQTVKRKPMPIRRHGPAPDIEDAPVPERTTVDDADTEGRVRSRRPDVPDWAAFERAEPGETQCTWCGGFSVDTTSPSVGLCRTCGTENDLRRRSSVVVRSWLHRKVAPPCIQSH